MHKKITLMLLVTCLDALFFVNAVHGVAASTTCPIGLLVSLCRLW